MEMATQTKTKAKPQKRATTNKQATVRTATATGNENLYTENICTIKEQKVEYRITRFKESPTKFVAAKQNNKTEIKFSQSKSKRNHLKILINLSIKFILCISQVNKSIFKILATTTHTNYKYEYNNSANCIINLQQQEQQKLLEKAQCFKTISSKIQIVKNFLKKYNIKTKIVINQIRHFVGICLKRLISLKRLQQIPVTHANLSKESLISIQIKIRTYKCGNYKEDLNQKDELKFILINERNFKLKNCQLYKESLKALLISLHRKSSSKNVKEIQNLKNCQECLKKNCQPFAKDCFNIQTYKNLDLERPDLYRKSIYKSILLSTSQFTKLKHQVQGHIYGNSLKVIQQLNFYKELFKIMRKIDQIAAEYALNCINNFPKKCSQLNEQRVALIIIITYTQQTIASRTTILAAKNKSLNNSEIKIHQLKLQSFTKHNNLLRCCCYSKVHLNVIHLISESQKILKYCKEFKNIKIPQHHLYSVHNFYQQTTKHRVAFEQSCEKIHRIKVNSQPEYKESTECDKKNWRHLVKDKDIIIHDFVGNSAQQYGQPIKFRNLSKHYIVNLHQNKVYLEQELQKNFKEKQKISKNSAEKYGQLNKYRSSLENYINKEQPTRYGLLFHSENDTPMNLQKVIKNSREKGSQLIQTRVVFKNDNGKVHPFSVRLVITLQESLNFYIKIQELPPNSSDKCGQLNKKRVPFKNYFTKVQQIIHDIKCHLEKTVVLNIQNVMNHRVALKDNFEITAAIETCTYGRLNKNDNNLKFKQNNYSIATNVQKTCGHLNPNNKKLELENYRNISAHKQHQFHKNSSNKNGFRQQISQSFINKAEEEMELLKYANIARQFQLRDSNNFYQLKSKQQTLFAKCQHILYSILFHYCCFCYWHIYGFPLVLEKMFKHLKDATVHVLTQLFKIPRTIKTTTKAALIYYNYGNIKVACEGKLKKLTKDNKDNQQNVLKNQTQAIGKETKLTTTALTACAYSSSCCLATSLTASSSFSTLSYYKSLESLILLPNKAKQLRQPHCHYQQYNHHKYHHHHHHYPHNRQKQETQQSQKQQQQQQKQQHYKSNSTFHLRLPSLLVFSRTLIILILLSSLWHTSEGFHGSGVKLSTNTVKTKYGLVRGIVVRSSPSLVEAYLGIPYASPPVGSLRFMPPITPSTWKNIRNADRFSPVCPQNVPIPPNGPEALLEVPRARLAQLRRLLPLLSNQSEDCLYLNIYVPYENRRHRRFTTNSGESNDTPKLPTILFIHGESYEWNSGNPYDGSELAAHGNVIVVTINFRLGILGFLKTAGKESAQGNFGLMDLVAGLHWLKENLPAFGGDPQKITLLGHGTGAALANILVVSPVASDLVQHTVMVSGSALSPWAIQKNPLFVKRRVAEQTGCHGDMLYYDLAPCLRTKTVAELLAVKIDHPRFLVGFAPFIDGTVISPNTDSIGKLSLPLGSAIVSTSGIEYANFPKRNLIFCLTSVESHLDLSAQDLEFGFNETRRDRILRTYVRNNFHYHLNEIFAVLKNEYTEWDKAIRSPLSSRDATLQFLSDGHTASSLIKLGFMHSLRGGRGYFLHFKHRTLEEEYPQRTGSVRGEDVPFWLGLPISPLFPHNYTTQERQISRLMLRYLANFAKTGNPNQSSLSSSLPSSSALIGSPLLTPLSSTSSISSQAANDSHDKIKKSPFNIVNDTSLTSSGPNIVEDVATAAAREALNLAVLYNQRRTKRTFYKRHSRSNDDHSSSASSEVNYFLSTNNNNNKLDNDEMPFWDAYDIVNQLYMELGNKAEIQSHYRGHKLSMWLNLIPQLHRHANMNDQSMRHHQFQDDLNNLNLYEGIVRAQMQTKPDDDDENLQLPKGRPTPPPPAQETNITQKSQAGTTECGVDGAMFVAEMTTLPPTDNHSLVLDSREKEMATASTGLIGNLEVLRRLSGKQFQSYTTALVATVAVGCFLLILNILIFAGIYHQREKRARDAKTKEELQDNDTSKNSSILKLNAIGSETGSFNGNVAGVSGKTTVVFGEYSCYDEKSLQTKDEKLIVELPPTKQMVDANWASCSTSTLDLLKTKHHTPLNATYTLSNVVPISTESQTEHLIGVNNLEMATYGPLPMASGLIIDPSFAATSSSSSGLLSKRGSFVGSSGQLNQYDFASVQSSDQMSFKDIENAVKASAALNDDITHDDDIPEPPPPPRSFQNMQQQPAVTSSSGSGGGILRQAGTTSATQTGGGKKRVHIQEISV